MNILTMNYKNVVSALVVTGVLFLGMAGGAFAQTNEVLQMSVDGNVATAEFMRGTPCTPYVLTWGDGAEEAFESDAEMCIQVIDEVSHTHTYEAAGTYTVELKITGNSWSEEVVVSAEGGNNENTKDKVKPEEELVSLYTQLKGLLEEMVSRLQGLLRN